MFIFIGNLNALATIVTMPFLATYTAINYSYFAMAMSFDIKMEEVRKTETPIKNGYGTIDNKSVKETDGEIKKMDLEVESVHINEDENVDVIQNGVQSPICKLNFLFLIHQICQVCKLY